MFNHSKDSQDVNLYFRKFVSSHLGNYHFDEPCSNILKEMEHLSDVPFDSDWNYLMTLVQLIEKIYSHEGFVSDRNYFRFALGNDGLIQDKGITKMDAIYSCCYQTLKKFWKEEKAPPFSRGAEPFDIDDL